MCVSAKMLRVCLSTAAAHSGRVSPCSWHTQHIHGTYSKMIMFTFQARRKRCTNFDQPNCVELYAVLWCNYAVIAYDTRGESTTNTHVTQFILPSRRAEQFTIDELHSQLSLQTQ